MTTLLLSEHIICNLGQNIDALYVQCPFNECVANATVRTIRISVENSEASPWLLVPWGCHHTKTIALSITMRTVHINFYHNLKFVLFYLSNYAFNQPSLR